MLPRRSGRLAAAIMPEVVDCDFTGWAFAVQPFKVTTVLAGVHGFIGRGRSDRYCAYWRQILNNCEHLFSASHFGSQVFLDCSFVAGVRMSVE